MKDNNSVKVGIAVLLVRDRKILVGKRLSPHAYGLDGLPGGHIEYGEDIKDAVKRELKEETGLDAKNIFLVEVTSNMFDNGNFYVTVFYSVEADGEPLNLEPHKKESWRWICPETYNGQAMPGLMQIIKRWNEISNRIGSNQCKAQ